MKISIVHNEYGKFSGEEAVVGGQRDLLKGRGHTVEMFTRTSADISDTLLAKTRALFSGIYSPASRRAFRHFLESSKPDLVHIHNLFPLISPSILPECRNAGVPVVMTLHNFRLICPNALLFTHGGICRQCLGGREWRCVTRNCEGSLPKSLGYALRTAAARRFHWFLDNVNIFVCLTEFQRQIYINEGFPSSNCVVIPNFISVAPLSALDSPAVSRSVLPALSSLEPSSACVPQSTVHGPQPYILYVGRISPEKDVPTLLEVARLLPDIAFRIAGSYWRMPDLPKQAPANVTFLGELAPHDLSDLYSQATVIVFATRCYEGFPTVILEAMSHAKPVICTDIGGLREIVEDGVTGRLYNTGDARQLAEAITELWHNPILCATLGAAGHRKMEMQYGPDEAYEQLMAVYDMARKQTNSLQGRSN